MAEGPQLTTYELFLDEKGEKISKSIGNGISVDDWLKFSNKKSLELFMFQNPNRAKRLFFDIIPKTTDELLKLKNDYENLPKEQKFNSPIWFIDEKNEEKTPEKISFNMILNLASVMLNQVKYYGVLLKIITPKLLKKITNF